MPLYKYRDRGTKVVQTKTKSATFADILKNSPNGLVLKGSQGKHWKWHNKASISSQARQLAEHHGYTSMSSGNNAGETTHKGAGKTYSDIKEGLSRDLEKGGFVKSDTPDSISPTWKHPDGTTVHVSNPERTYSSISVHHPDDKGAYPENRSAPKGVNPKEARMAHAEHNALSQESAQLNRNIPRD